MKEAEGASYQIEDVSLSLRAYQDKLEYDPERLERIEQRLSLIRDLKRKYGDSINDMNQYAEEAEEELKQLDSRGERRSELQQEEAVLRKNIGEVSFRLSTIRHEAADKLSGEIEKELTHLNMAQVRFQVQFSRFDTENEVELPDGHSYPFTNSLDWRGISPYACYKKRSFEGGCHPNVNL